MELTRGEIIVILGLTALAFRAVPQFYFAGQKFPEAWDRLLRYLSYALLCGIIATTLFMKGATFESDIALYRAASLMATIIVARWTGSPVSGLIVGTILVSVFSWIR
jgi:branched-subunit amino acid transport protein